ncbi:hypothetical protein FRB99_005610 [Tulasnella sp. 403]|nr:hypothetical protein FRB99_005610 [Tulasnella sp. 403]
MAHNEEGLGHKLLSLLPLTRHATFRVKLTMHDVTNIPFQNGSFALRWKFKNASRSNTLNNTNGHKLNTTRPPTPTDHHRVKPFATTRTKGAESEAEKSRKSFESDLWSRRSSTEKGKGKAADADDIRMSDDFAQLPRPPAMTGLPLPGAQPSTTPTSNGKYGRFLSPVDPPDTSPAVPSVSVSLASAGATPIPTPVRIDDTSQKGSTEYVPLKEHTVRWEHTVEVVVHLKVRKETNGLLPCDLKLVLQEQLSASGSTTSVDPLTPARFGVLVLNLAEYADRGPVTRRYLLRESKTNATLKLTIEAVHVSGDKNYVVPDLQKGQPVAGVAGVLSNDHLLPFMNFSNRSSFSGLGSSSRTPSPGSQESNAFPRRPNLRHTKSSIQTLHQFLADPSLHTPETVIEYIFNPFPTTNTNPSPFTYHIPASPNGYISASGSSVTGSGRAESIASSSLDGTGESEQGHTRPRRKSTRPSTGTTLASVTDPSQGGDASDEDEGDEEEDDEDGSMENSTLANNSLAPSTSGGGGWWRRLGGGGSRPSPNPSQPKLNRPLTASSVATTNSAKSDYKSPTRLMPRQRTNSTLSQRSASTSAWIDVVDRSAVATPAVAS